LAAVNKNFVVKNGIEVGGNLIFGDVTNLRVGIGTTIPGQTLDVRGGIGATFVSIGQSLTASTATISTVRSTTLTVGGGFNFNSGIGTALNLSGVTTVGSLSIGSTQVISSGRQLQNIASLDATTTATIEAAIASGPNTFTDLTVTGIATFNNNVEVAGIITAPAIRVSWAQVGSGLTFKSGIGTNLNISGVSTLGVVTASQLYVSGISTFNGTVNVGFLTTSNLYISGIATAQDFDALSDERYKTNINTVGNALLKVQQLRGVKFDWKESGLGSYGVVAQELEEVLPELVHGNDPKTVNYNGIIGVLIEAIKELQDEIAELREKIDK